MFEVTFLIGSAGNLGFLYGAWALAKRKMSGWYAQIIANSCYVVQSVIMNNPSLLIVSLVLIGVNLYGIYSWKKAEKLPFTAKNNPTRSNFIQIMRRHDGGF